MYVYIILIGEPKIYRKIFLLLFSHGCREISKHTLLILHMRSNYYFQFIYVFTYYLYKVLKTNIAFDIDIRNSQPNSHIKHTAI